MRGLPALIRASHYPAIDVQAFPKAALATGKFEAIKNPARWPGFVRQSYTRRNDRMGIISLIRSLMSTGNHAALPINNPSASNISSA